MGSTSSTMSSSVNVSVNSRKNSAKAGKTHPPDISVPEPQSAPPIPTPPPPPPTVPSPVPSKDQPVAPPLLSSSQSNISSKSNDGQHSGINLDSMKKCQMKPEDNSKLSKLKKLITPDEWKSKLNKLKLAHHDVQSALKIIKEYQNTLNSYLESSYECVASLKNSQSDVTFLENLNVLFFELEVDQRTPIGDFLAYIHFPSESLSFYKSTLAKLKLDHFNDTVSENIQRMDDTVKQIIYLVRSHWWNFSDASQLFCASLARHGIVQEMVQDMRNVVSAPENDLKYSFAFESGIGVLHNVSKLSTQRQLYRDLKVVDILGEFLNVTNIPKVTMLVLLTLAHIIDENQTDLLFSHETSFDLLLHLAKQASKTSDLRYDGFSLEELLQGMLGLSKNDKVKRLLVEKGILSLLDSILNQSREKEQLVSVKLLWELAFDPENKTKIKERQSLMDAVQSLSKSHSGKISRSAQGILWVLEMGRKKESKKKKKETTPRKTMEKSGSGHLMISYNWGDQKKLIEVKDTLKAHSYNVWMDIENISGSTLQAMAEAVEKAAAVLICMSESYKESSNCRAEAEYAFSLKKPIIPLLMQRSYKPDGWLGILLGTKLFFDFSGKYDFNDKSKDLMKELGDLGQEGELDDERDVVDGPLIKEIAPPVTKTSSSEMKKLDVGQWLKENNLENVQSLQNLKSQHLMFLKRMSSRAPEQFYKFMMDFLHGNLTIDKLDTLMKVTDAIEKLRQT